MPLGLQPFQVGNPQITKDRGTRNVKCRRSGKVLGTLHDFIPFYFTPLSPMLYQVITGNGPATQTPRDELVIIIVELNALLTKDRQAVVADGQAFSHITSFELAPVELASFIDIPTIVSGDFKRRDDDLDRFRRYQAEALVYQHLELVDMTGLAVCSTTVEALVRDICIDSPLEKKIGVRPNFFFLNP